MRIIAFDQARHGGWSVFEYPSGKLVAYGSFAYEQNRYTYPQAIMRIEKLAAALVREYDVSALFLEDIQLQFNVNAFKKLAQLQGVLVNFCEKRNLLYGIVTPTQWQNHCKARGRNAKELKSGITKLEHTDKKESKKLSLQFVKDRFHIDTDNDNVADAICIGYYVCDVVKIK